MPSRCTLGCTAGSLLDRRGGPVLPEYTYNVIRNRNIKVNLMCLIDERSVSFSPRLREPCERVITGFSGFNARFTAREVRLFGALTK